MEGSGFVPGSKGDMLQDAVIATCMPATVIILMTRLPGKVIGGYS